MSGEVSGQSGLTGLIVREQRQNTFLEKIRTPEAKDVVKELSSFLRQFVLRFESLDTMKKQGDYIHEFIDSMKEKLVSSHALWKKCSAEESADIVEGLERYITIKLYKLIFPPAVPVMVGEKRPLHVQQDEELSAKIDSLWFLDKSHLDIHTSGFVSLSFVCVCVYLSVWYSASLINDICINRSKQSEENLARAIEELGKINNYKSPKDKVIIIMNCCKILSSLLTTCFLSFCMCIMNGVVLF